MASPPWKLCPINFDSPWLADGEPALNRPSFSIAFRVIEMDYGVTVRNLFIGTPA